MSARSSGDARVTEMYRVIWETRERIRELNLTKSAFVSDESAQGRMNADGIFMCVFRVAEEADNMSNQAKRTYSDIPWKAIHGMRNIFAHDYGRLDRSIAWSAVTEDFPKLEAFCRRNAADRGLKL